MRANTAKLVLLQQAGPNWIGMKCFQSDAVQEEDTKARPIGAGRMVNVRLLARNVGHGPHMIFPTFGATVSPRSRLAAFIFYASR